MFRFATLTLVLLCSVLTTSLLQGCGDSATSRAAGTYELDRAAIKSALQAKIDETDDPTEQYMNTQFMQGIDEMPMMTFTLSKDGTFEATSELGSGDDDASGTWTLEDSTITFEMTETDTGDPDRMTGTLTGDTIKLNPPDGEMMPFNLLFKKKKA